MSVLGHGSALGLSAGFLRKPLQRAFQRRIRKLPSQFNQPLPPCCAQHGWRMGTLSGRKGDLHPHLNSSNLTTLVLE